VDIVVTIHSVIRWPVLALALLGLGAALASGASARLRRAIASSFVGLLDLQLLLGVVLLFQSGVFSTTWRHVVFMVLAVVTAHGFHARARKHPAPGPRDHLLVFLVPGILLLFGLLQVL
jgi:hypothetical protein